MTRIHVAVVGSALSCFIILETFAQTSKPVPDIARWQLASRQLETECRPYEESGAHAAAAQCYDEVARMVTEPSPISVEALAGRRLRSESPRLPQQT